MGKIFILVFSSLMLNSCFGSKHSIPFEPVNPNATQEVRSLLAYLYRISGQKTLSGQHNYPGEFTASTDSAIAITGKIPVVWGCDMIGSSRAAHHGYTRQQIVDEAIRQHHMGSIITIMYHQVKPFDHDSLGFNESVKGRVTDQEWEQIVSPGADYYDMLIEKLDSVAVYLKQLQEQNIPVLWRPYHEMNGMWFWYGDRKGPEGFVKLWKIVFDRYVHHHRLNNLIWVWNANAPRDWKDDEAYAYDLYYPGHDYVDILATDIYKNDYKQSHHDQLYELGEGRLIALGECGILPTPESIDGMNRFAWFMTWANFIWKYNTKDDVRRLYDDPRVITLDEHIEMFK